MADTKILDLTQVTTPVSTYGMVVADSTTTNAYITISDLQKLWTTDIDADGFDLNDLSNILFRTSTGPPTAGTVAIWYETGGLELNAMTGETISLNINKNAQLTVSSTDVSTNNNSLTLGTGNILFQNAGQEIGSGTQWLTFDMPTGDGWRYQVNSVPEYTFNATEADFIGNPLVNFGYLESNATNPSTVGAIRLGVGELIGWREGLNAGNATIAYGATGNKFEFVNPFTGGSATFDLIFNTTVLEYSFTGSELDVFANNIVNVGYLESNATNPASTGEIRLGNNEGIFWRNNANTLDFGIYFDTNDRFYLDADVVVQNGAIFTTTTASASTLGSIKLGNTQDIGWRNSTNTDNHWISFDTDVFLININSTLEYDFSATQADFQANNIVGVGGLTMTGTLDLGNGATLSTGGSGLVMGLALADLFYIDIDSTNEYQFSATQADFNANNLINFGYLESNATNPASAGTIRLGNTESIKWRNAANTDDIEIDVNNFDAIRLIIDGTVEYYFNDLTFSMNNKVISSIGYASFGALSATTGAVRFLNAQEINWRNAAGSGDLGISINASDLFVFNSTTETFGANIITNHGTVTPVSGDFVLIHDATDGTIKKADASNFLGGGSQTPWAQTIDAADFSLQNLDILDFNERTDAVTITAAQIYWEAATGMFLNVPTGDAVVVEVNGSNEYSFNETQANFIGNNLVNFGYLESNATNPATTGTIRLGAAEQIVWRNFANTNNNTLNFSSDILDIGFDGSVVYSFSATEAEISGANIVNFGYIESNATNPATTGTIRLGNTETIVGRNSANSADIIMWSINSVNKIEAGSILDMNNLQIDDVGTINGRSSVDFNLNAPNTQSLNLQVNNTTELAVSGTVINAPTNKFQENGVNISPIGLHDFYIDAGGFIPVDSGALATRLVGTAGNQKAFAYIPFAGGVTSFAVAKLTLPRTYNLGTITAVVQWTSQTEGAGTVIWQVSAAAVGDGEAISTNYGAQISSTDTQLTIDQVQTSPRTTAITIGNTPVDGDTIFLKIQRLSSDTFANEAQLLGVWVEIRTDLAVSA